MDEFYSQFEELTFVFTKEISKNKFDRELEHWLKEKYRTFYKQYHIILENMDYYLACALYVRCEKLKFKVIYDNEEISLDHLFSIEMSK